MICPKCGKQIESVKCRNCGFDFSSENVAFIGNDFRRQSDAAVDFIRKLKEKEAAATKPPVVVGAKSPQIPTRPQIPKSQKPQASKTPQGTKVPTMNAANRAAADRVISMINSIGTVDCSESTGRRIREARADYSRLTVEQRKLVPWNNYSKLTDAERRYESLRKEYEARQKRNRRIRIAGLCAALIFVVGSAALFGLNILNKYTFVKEGDTITLGKYEQDNNPDNGAEDIEWVVLKKNGNYICVVSKYCLDTMPFNDTDSFEHTDWENCSLRQWLNGDFYENSFTDDEKRHIANVDLQNPDSPIFHQPGGNNTIDKVYLLSAADLENLYPDMGDYGVEMMTYSTNDGGQAKMAFLASFNQLEDLQIKYTEYGKESYIDALSKETTWKTEEDARNDYSEGEAKYGEKASWWWLRTPGQDWFSTMYVTESGIAFSGPSHATTGGVRPAIVISAKTIKSTKQSKTENTDASDKRSDTSAGASVTPVQVFSDDQKVFFTTSTGEVLRAGYNSGNYKDVDKWKDIKKVAGGEGIVLGLKNDGKVLVSTSLDLGYNLSEIKSLKNIVDISVCNNAFRQDEDTARGSIFLLTGDGNIYEFSRDGSYSKYGNDTPVKQIDTSDNTVVMLWEDGGISHSSYNKQDYSEIYVGKDIKQVVCGEYYIAVLKDDGTVEVSGGCLPSMLQGVGSIGEDGYSKKIDVGIDVSGWKDIVAISGGKTHLVALRKDGKVLASGLNYYGQCDTKNMTDIKSVDASNNMTLGFAENAYPVISGKIILNNIADMYNKAEYYICYTK